MLYDNSIKGVTLKNTIKIEDVFQKTDNKQIKNKKSVVLVEWRIFLHIFGAA
nr:MAG TPA: hypothetical protein [Caudoviricetes sp.]